MAKVIATITIPTRDNDHLPIVTAHSWLHTQLLQHFGGYSKRVEDGYWRDPDTGRTYEDENIVYTVALDPDAFTAHQFHQIACEAGRMARQLAVFITYAGKATIASLTDAED